jgi:hypothetical protein
VLQIAPISLNVVMSIFENYDKDGIDWIGSEKGRWYVAWVESCIFTCMEKLSSLVGVYSNRHPCRSESVHCDKQILFFELG